MSGLSVKELRAALKAASINYDGCVEKSDLIALFEKHNLSGAAASTTETEQPAVEIVDAPATAAPATAVPDAAEWAQMSAAKLKKLLVQHGVSVEGCFEKADFLERAEKELGKGASASDEDGGAMGRLKKEHASARESELAAKRELAAKMEAEERREREERRAAAKAAEEAEKPPPPGVDPGWLVDMFGVRRGRCIRDSSCWRFDPPPPTAGKVLASNWCRRCKRSADDHEHCGLKAPGTNNPNEPDMVDEKGVCWKLKVSGGGGARDSPDYTWVQLKGVEPPPKDTKYKRATPQEVQRTGAARADSAALNYTGGTAAIASASAAATAEQSSEAAEEAAARMRAARDID